MKNSTDTYSPKQFIRNLLNETDLPRNLNFSVVSKDGQLQVNLNKRTYDRKQKTSCLVSPRIC